MAYEEGNDVLAALTVHKGFMDAFRSVRAALLQVIHSLLLLPPNPPPPNSSDLSKESTASREENKENKEDKENKENKEKKESVGIQTDQHWHIYVTGHSLGGALATLFTFELGRIRAGETSPISFFLLFLLLRSQLNAKLFFRFHKLPLKITEISPFFEEKIEKVGV